MNTVDTGGYHENNHNDLNLVIGMVAQTADNITKLEKHQGSETRIKEIVS